MPPVRLVLDSNSYFRLACSIRPLLDASFRPEPYRLAVLKELDEEFKRSSRLQSKFFWVRQPEYQNDRRKGLLTVSQKDREQVELVFDYILHNEAIEGSGVSLVDIRVLAIAQVLKYTAVTDDGDMRAAAEAFGIPVCSTIELMKRMLDCGHVDMTTIRQIVELWDYENDLPSPPPVFRKAYRRTFGEEML